MVPDSEVNFNLMKKLFSASVIDRTVTFQIKIVPDSDVNIKLVVYLCFARL